MSRNADIKRFKINGRIKTRDQCIYTGKVTEVDCGCVSTLPYNISLFLWSLLVFLETTQSLGDDTSWCL